MLGRVYSPARAAITYSHPYYTPRTVVCRRALSVVSGGVLLYWIKSANFETTLQMFSS